MTTESIVLVGAPDSGKTNYLGRLWASLRSEGSCLRVTGTPDRIGYVEEALNHLLSGKFAPRTDRNPDASGRSLSFPVAGKANGEESSADVLVPDVSGELWKEAVETSELPNEWMAKLNGSVGALLFIRIGSPEVVELLDWVTARDLLGPNSLPQEPSSAISTAVQMCELLRYLEHGLAQRPVGQRPRVALLVTAWDMLDAERAALGPIAYIAKEFPLLAGRIRDISSVDVRVFGVSVVGGDFAEDAFRDRFLKGEIADFGYVVADADEGTQKKPDLAIPVGWVLDGLREQ